MLGGLCFVSAAHYECRITSVEISVKQRDVSELFPESWPL